MKICSLCDRDLPRSAFSPHANAPDGLQARCKKCCATACRAWNRSPEGRTNRLLRAARERASARGQAFDLDVAWLLPKIEAGVCEATGEPFDFNTSYSSRVWSPSLDRINPLVGYTKNNTQVVAWIYNAAKGVGTHEDVLKLARAICKTTS